MEHKSLEEGGKRVKFEKVWIGENNSILGSLTEDILKLYKREVSLMAEALWEMELSGAAPVLPDGKVGGNASFMLKISDTQEVMVVSKSGKTKGEYLNTTEDLCLVPCFDLKKWSLEYHSVSSSVIPTSDSPLHFSAYHACSTQDIHTAIPGCILHGHALETEEEADRLGFPISHEETLFSTPEDSDALVNLLSKYPYPQNKVFIRKGHGFLLLGRDMKETLQTYRELILPHL